MEYAHSYPIRRRWATGQPGGFSRLDKIRHRAHGLLGFGRIAKAQVSNVKNLAIAAAGLQRRRLSSVSYKMPAVRTRISKRRTQSPASIRPSGKVRSTYNSPRTPAMSGRQLFAWPSTPANSSRGSRTPKMSWSTQKVKINTGQGIIAKPRGSWGASTSKSKGRFKKPTRRTRNLFESVGKNGVQTVFEYGTQLGSSTANSVMVMHTAAKSASIRHMIALLLAKEIAKAANLEFIEGGQLIIPTGQGMIYTFQIQYKEYPAGPIQTWLYDTTTGTTWFNLIQDLKDKLVGFTVAPNVLPTPQFSFENLLVRAKGDAVGRTYDWKQVDLRHAKVTYYVKSSLKMQNRTINASGGNEESVDNVPIYGKSYTGKGNLMSHIKNVAGVTQEDYYLPDEQFLERGGIVSAVYAGNTVYSEPPGFDLVRHVSAIGKAHLDPGEIKTSVLTMIKTISLNALFRASVRGYQATGSTFQLPISLGNFKAYHFEKMIQTVATDNVNFIKLAVEIDEKHAAHMKTSPIKKTTPFIYNNPV